MTSSSRSDEDNRYPQRLAKCPSAMYSNIPFKAQDACLLLINSTHAEPHNDGMGKEYYPEDAELSLAESLDKIW